MKDSKKAAKKIHDAKPEVKRRRRYKSKARSREQLLKLETDGPKWGMYQSGVSIKTTNKKKKSKKPRKKRVLIPCDCGAGKVHSYRSSKYCQHEKQDKSDGTTPKDKNNTDNS